MDHQIFAIEVVDNPSVEALQKLAVALQKISIEAGDGPLVGLIVLAAGNQTMTYDHVEHPLLSEINLIDRALVLLQRRRDQIEVEGEKA